MFKTGNPLIDAFSRAIVFLPLLPVLIILFRRIYREDALNFLMILCLLNFIPGFTLQLLQVPDPSQVFIQHIFSLLELLLLIQIFKPVLPDRIRDLINIFSIAFVSAVITFYLIKGADRQKLVPEALQSALIIVLALLGLRNIVKNDNLRVFHSPGFWIATGSLFYFVIVFLLAFVHWCCYPLNRSAGTDKTILLDVASLARYFFYTLAVVFYSGQKA
jgi:hypothetical protein